MQRLCKPQFKIVFLPGRRSEKRNAQAIIHLMQTSNTFNLYPHWRTGYVFVANLMWGSEYGERLKRLSLVSSLALPYEAHKQLIPSSGASAVASDRERRRRQKYRTLLSALSRRIRHSRRPRTSAAASYSEVHGGNNSLVCVSSAAGS